VLCTLKMETARSSGILVMIYRATLHDIPENNEFHEEYFLVGCQFGEITTFRGNIPPQS
jgi:hypothetical protein